MQTALKPLYLDGQRPQRVSLDGPALRVDIEGAAPGRYPLRRLSRVVASSQVEWDTPALVACLAAGIVVSFLDREGQMAGICMGARREGMGLYRLLEEFAHRPDWPRHYENWYDAMERRCILAVIRRMPVRPADLRPRTVRQACRDTMGSLASGRVVDRVCGYLEAALAACAVRTARDAGITPALLVDEATGHALLRDLGRLAAWQAQPLAYRVVRAHEDSLLPPRRALAEVAEAHAGACTRLTHELLGRLEQRISELCMDGGAA